MNQPNDYYEYIFDYKKETFVARHYIIYKDFTLKGRLPYILEDDETEKIEHIYPRMTNQVSKSGTKYIIILEEDDSDRALDEIEEFLQQQIERYETSLEGAMKRFDSFLISRENFKWRA